MAQAALDGPVGRAAWVEAFEFADLADEVDRHGEARGQVGEALLQDGGEGQEVVALALQGAARQYFYALVTRDRMRERHGWTKRRGEQQTDLAAAILAVAVRRKQAPSAPTVAIEAECRVLPAPDEEEAPTPPQGAVDGDCDAEVVP
jgi:hypothetical protein